MVKSFIYGTGKNFLFVACLFLGVFLSPSTKAAGVTIITHGFGGSVTGWISGMASQITNYPGFPGINSTIYTITLTTDGTDIYYQWSRVAGGTPTNTDSGEIIVLLDWSQMAGSANPLSSDYNISTYNVAQAASWVLMQTNSIADLGGHALVEFPIHMIGHSRGGSLITEISRLLGTNGLWVDHLTTLDPHPLNNDGNFELLMPTDASAQNTYANVLFHDNYWQNLGILLDPDGEAVNGAYNRQLQNISGGYDNVGSFSAYHSNVHLWYHGTLDFDNPATDGDSSNPLITTTERQSWWTSYESYGTNAGFIYSLIGHGDRTSLVEPEGVGYQSIRDGYNQYWDFGAGVANPNRTALTANSGTWPNIIKFNIIGTNVVPQGDDAIVKFYYQYGGQSNVTVQVFYDQDFNPCNSNSTVVLQGLVTNTGTGSVYFYSGLGLATTNVSPGTYSVYTRISDGAHVRYLYAPELLTIVSTLQPPVLAIVKLNSTQFHITANGVSGQIIAIQTSADLQSWQPLATNTLTTSRWDYTNTTSANSSKRFYRARLLP